MALKQSLRLLICSGLLLMVVGCHMHGAGPYQTGAMPHRGYGQQPVYLSQGGHPVQGYPVGGPIYQDPGYGQGGHIIQQPGYPQGGQIIGSPTPAPGYGQGLGSTTTIPGEFDHTHNSGPGTVPDYPDAGEHGGPTGFERGTADRGGPRVPDYEAPNPRTPGRGVPNYPDDPGLGNPEPFLPDGGVPDDNSQPFGDGEPFKETRQPEPFERTGKTDAPRMPVLPRGEPDNILQASGEFKDDNSFAQPVPFQANFQDDTPARPASQAKGQPNPYGFDKNNYSWLRGIVDYDDTDRSWNIMYSLRPTADDTFGGSLTLIGDDRMNLLKNGQVYLLQGYVDLNTLDNRGKACYVVQNLVPLKPKR